MRVHKQSQKFFFQIVDVGFLEYLRKHAGIWFSQISKLQQCNLYYLLLKNNTQCCVAGYLQLRIIHQDQSPICGTKNNAAQIKQKMALWIFYRVIATVLY